MASLTRWIILGFQVLSFWLLPGFAQSACDILKPLTVRIEGGGERGAGVIVAGDPGAIWIATSGHVVANSTPTVYFWQSPTSPVHATLRLRREFGGDSVSEIAILRVSASALTPRTPVHLRRSDIEEGEHVSYAGHPGELDWQCFPNNQVVSSIEYKPNSRPKGNKDLFLFTGTASALHGMSGGPVSDAGGNLLGIIYGQISGNVIAIRIAPVLDLLSTELGVGPLVASPPAATESSRPSPAPGTTPPPAPFERRPSVDWYVQEWKTDVYGHHLVVANGDSRIKMETGRAMMTVTVPRDNYQVELQCDRGQLVSILEQGNLKKRNDGSYAGDQIAHLLDRDKYFIGRDSWAWFGESNGGWVQRNPPGRPYNNAPSLNGGGTIPSDVLERLGQHQVARLVTESLGISHAYAGTKNISWNPEDAFSGLREIGVKF